MGNRDVADHLVALLVGYLCCPPPDVSAAFPHADRLFSPLVRTHTRLLVIYYTELQRKLLF